MTNKNKEKENLTMQKEIANESTYELMVSLWNSNWLACKNVKDIATEDMKNIVNALKRQISKKVIREKYFYGEKCYCPCCGRLFSYEDWNFRFCKLCGTALDWSR